jgi:hypothetical protein
MEVICTWQTSKADFKFPPTLLATNGLSNTSQILQILSSANE